MQQGMAVLFIYKDPINANVYKFCSSICHHPYDVFPISAGNIQFMLQQHWSMEGRNPGAKLDYVFLLSKNRKTIPLNSQKVECGYKGTHCKLISSKRLQPHQNVMHPSLIMSQPADTQMDMYK